MAETSRGWIGDAIAGGIAGAVATWVMDLTTTGMYDAQSADVNRREEAAHPNGRSSVGNMVAQLESVLGLRLTDDERTRLTSVVHYGLGVAPGAMYGVVSRRVPALRFGGGLGYGLALFVVNDEWMNTALGLAGPFSAYPREAHLRGLVGHAVLGTMTEAVISSLGR